MVHLDPDQGDPWEPGGALHINPAWQGSGRFDIPQYARTLYLAESAASAVGEAFASQSAIWSDDIFHSGFTDHRRALVRYQVDTTALVELDDATFLAARNYRPSDIVARNRVRSQEIALELWLEGLRMLRWWSYHRPEWRAISVWAGIDEQRPGQEIVEVVDAEPLSISHPAVIVAADALTRNRRTRRRG